MYIEYPHIYGTTEEKLDQISSYLFKLAEISNYNLEQTTPEGIFRQAAEAVASAEAETIEKEKKAKFIALRDLIIKSAGSVMISEQEITRSLSGLFVAESDFGTFKKETEQKFKANSESFTSLFAKDEEITANLTSYKSEMQNYIFAGYDNDTFVLDIGLLKDTYSVDDKTVLNQTPKKLRITPDRLSLFSGDNEVAYLSEQAIYFPNAHITGGTLNIGGGTFTVNSDGVVTASSGTIAGWKIGTGADGLPAGATAIFNTVEGTEGKFSIGLQASAASTANINFFVKEYNTKSKTWEDVFYVKNNGKLKATKAEITGKITATSGDIGGFTINASSLSCGSIGSDNGFLLYPGGSSTTYDIAGSGYKSFSMIVGSNFGVTPSGKLHASGAEISGKITATTGDIGGWKVGTGSQFNPSRSAIYYTFTPSDPNYSGDIQMIEMGIFPGTYKSDRCFYISEKIKDETKNETYWKTNIALRNNGGIECLFLRAETRINIGGHMIEKFDDDSLKMSCSLRVKEIKADGGVSIKINEGTTKVVTSNNTDITTWDSVPTIHFYLPTCAALTAEREVISLYSAGSGTKSDSILRYKDLYNHIALSNKAKKIVYVDEDGRFCVAS